MTTVATTDTDWLGQLVDEAAQAALRAAEGATRGVVMTAAQPPPYVRVDCDGRALAYIRRRPRKGAVRVDVSGLWMTPPATKAAFSGIRCPAHTGAALWLRTPDDVVKAERFLAETVQRTRAHEARARR